MKRENPSIEICPGITRRTVANGKTMYQMIATLAAGSRMPSPNRARLRKAHSRASRRDLNPASLTSSIVSGLRCSTIAIRGRHSSKIRFGETPKLSRELPARGGQTVCYPVVAKDFLDFYYLGGGNQMIATDQK